MKGMIFVRIKRLSISAALALAVLLLAACTQTIPPDEPVSDGTDKVINETNNVIDTTKDAAVPEDGAFYIAGRDSGVIVKVPEAGWELADDEATDDGVRFSAVSKNDTINITSGKTDENIKVCKTQEELESVLTEELTEGVDFKIIEFSYDESETALNEAYTYIVTDGSKGGTNIIRLTVSGDEYTSRAAYLTNPTDERIEQIKTYLDEAEIPQ